MLVDYLSTKGDRCPPDPPSWEGVRGAFRPSALTIRPKEFTDNLSRYIATIGQLGVDFKPKQHMVMHLDSRRYDWTPLTNKHKP